MKKTLLASAIMLATISTASNAEIVHTRLIATATDGIPHMGISQDDQLFIDYSYEDSMVAATNNPDSATYNPSIGDVKVSINSSKGFVSSSANDPGWSSVNVTTFAHPSGGSSYIMRMDGAKINFNDTFGNPMTEEASIEINGLTANYLQTPRLIDVSELIPEHQPTDPFGRVFLAGQAFDVTSIESCQSSGCGDIPETKVKVDISAYNPSNNDGGFTKNTPVTFQLELDTYTAAEQNSSPGNYLFRTTDFNFSYTIPETGVQVKYTPDQNTMPTTINIVEFEETQGVWVVDLIMMLQIPITDSMGFTSHESIDVVLSLRGDSSTGGKLPDLSKYDVQWGDIRAIGTNPHSHVPLTVSNISLSSSESGGLSGPADTSNLSLSLNVISQFPGPVYGSHVEMSVENSQQMGQYFGYSVEAVFPSGFSWPIELHSSSEFSVWPGSTWNGAFPVSFEPSWPSGDYVVRVKLLTNQGQYVTKEIPVTQGN